MTKLFLKSTKRRTFDIELMSNPFKEVCVANTNLPFSKCFFFWKKAKTFETIFVANFVTKTEKEQLYNFDLEMIKLLFQSF